jgi:hypothetical protein
MIVWRDKIRAFAIHFGLTLIVGLAAAALIFLVWFPDPFDDMVGGTKLFLLVIGCDLALGPLISLVIFDRRKSRRELITDYSIVGILQLAALGYGIYAVSMARPVYIAFTKDRFEVVTAREIPQADLAEARHPNYRSLPWDGPRYVGTHVPAADNNDALDRALSGTDISARPKFYVDLESQREEITRRAQPASTLVARHPEAKPLLAQIAPDKDATEIHWLPVKHSRGFWTAIVDTDTGKPASFIEIDPY